MADASLWAGEFVPDCGLRSAPHFRPVMAAAAAAASGRAGAVSETASLGADDGATLVDAPCATARAAPLAARETYSCLRAAGAPARAVSPASCGHVWHVIH